MDIEIADLWVTQRNLKRGIIPNFKLTEPVELVDVDGKIVINNGHHRIMTMLVAGKEVLLDGEYTLRYDEHYQRNVIGQIKDILKEIINENK